VAEPSQPLLPPGTGPKLARALLDLLGALVWFMAALLCGSDATDLFGDSGGTNDIFAFIAVGGALTVGVAFGLRMASVALDRVPAWVPRVEAWHWVALLVWFGLAVGAVRI
jgi:hypothetical protein